MFLIIETRPNIAFALLVVSCLIKNLSWQYTKAIKTIIQYLKAIKTLGITYGGEKKVDLNMKGYSDFNEVGDHITKKLTSRFIFTLNGGPISWYSKKQVMMALSLIKIKYVALSLAAKETT